MGAWGHGYFDNDAALDFMGDVEEADKPEELLAETFADALDTEYLEAAEGCAVIVAAAYVDRQLNGTLYSAAAGTGDLVIDTIPSRHPRVQLAGLRAKALRALQRVLAADSELRELWEDNEEDYPAWQQGVEQLLRQLSTFAAPSPTAG